MQSNISDGCESVCDILQALAAVELSLRAGGSDAFQQIDAQGNVQHTGDIRRQQFALVEAPRCKFFGMKGNGNQPIKGN